MDHSVAAWLNRLGLLMGFLAFWFAAPELLGERRLRKLEDLLEKLLGDYLHWALWRRRVVTSLAILLLVSPVIAWALAMGQLRLLAMVGLLIWAFYMIFFLAIARRQGLEGLQGWWADFDIDTKIKEGGDREKPGVIYDFVTLPMVILSPLGIVEIFAEKGLLTLSRRLLPVLANDQEIRRHALFLGGLLFALGVALQFAATF